MAPTKPKKRRKAELADLLKDGGVQTSSELIGQLKATGLSEENARQVLRRYANTPEVWRSEKLRLANDERLFAERSIVGTRDFYEGVAERLRQTSRWGMSRCLEVLANRLALHRTDVMRLLAVSPNGMKEHPEKRLYESEVAGLEELGAAVIHRNTPLESLLAPHVVGQPGVDELAAEAAVSVRKECLLAKILIDRLRRQNMFSWNRIDIADSETPYTTFNDQIFSAFAFSYLSPLVKWKDKNQKPTPCPVLFDVYQGFCVASQVYSFLQRIERATHRNDKVMPALGVIAAKDFEPEAWSLARQKGLMTVSFRQMFGDEALEAMVLVDELLHDLSHGCPSVLKSEFNKFSNFLDELKTNPIISTLRSIGFEAIAGLVLRSTGYEGVELGWVVPWQDTTRDVDAFGFKGDDLIIVECKAYHRHKSLLTREVTKFFTQTVPALKKFLSSKGKVIANCRAEIWTTGPLGRLAREELHALSRPNGDTWDMLSGNKVRELLPSSIRQRGCELLDAIRLERTRNDEAEDAEDDATADVNLEAIEASGFDAEIGEFSGTQSQIAAD